MSRNDDISMKFSVAKSDIEIPMEDHAAYIRFHDDIDLEKYGETEVLHMSKSLFGKETPLAEKREILFRLAHIGTVPSFDTICEFLKNPDVGLRTWAVLCLEECRTFLEMDLLDEEEGSMIMGPSGGIEQRIRHYVVIGNADAKHWQESDHKTVRSALLRSCDTWNSQMEDATFGDDYIRLAVLIHIDTAADDLVMDAIRLSNELQPLLQEHYFITNVAEPDEETIHKYLKECAR
ncbi:MAG: hypothetical protein AAB853_03710 [Patescibacteria group bacterium]